MMSQRQKAMEGHGHDVRRCGGVDGDQANVLNIERA